MRIEEFEFGCIRIDGQTYDHDVVLRNDGVFRRKKKPSKRYKKQLGHTPLSSLEDIPWACERLVIGTGAYGRLPVMDDVKREAKRRGLELVILPTAEAIEAVNRSDVHTNAVLHVTC